jgi:hypothetical protein
MHYQAIYLAEHQVVLVELEIIRNNHNRILEIIVVVVRYPMDVVVVQEAEVDVIILMDQIVAIIIIIQMITVRMAMRVMKHLHNHLHGLVVVIIRVVDHSEIEYDLTMIGK